MIEVIFLAVGLIIVLGFVSYLFFDKTKISDILILMTVGIIIRHNIEALDSEIFMEFAPYVGAVALVIILFDGGINLKFQKVLQQLISATTFTLAVFVLTSLLIMLTMTFAFGWDPLIALLLGTILGGTSSAIVIPLMLKTDVIDYVRIILTLDSTLTDTLCIISAIAIVGVITSGSANIQAVVNNLFEAFSIATFVSLIFSLLWMKTIGRFQRMRFTYLLTLALVFIQYTTVEYIGGNGAIAAFAFGLLVGNSKNIAKFLEIEVDFDIEEKIRSFHEEVSFLIRTFFFVYMGLIFDLTIVNNQTLQMASYILIAAIVGRTIPTIFLINSKGKLRGCEITIENMIRGEISRCSVLIATMMPRGLAAAVLASSPKILEVIPHEDSKVFVGLVILTLLSTNIVSTVGFFFYEIKRPKKCLSCHKKIREPDVEDTIAA